MLKYVIFANLWKEDPETANSLKTAVNKNFASTAS